MDTIAALLLVGVLFGAVLLLGGMLVQGIWLVPLPLRIFVILGLTAGVRLLFDWLQRWRSGSRPKSQKARVRTDEATRVKAERDQRKWWDAIGTDMWTKSQEWKMLSDRYQSSERGRDHSSDVTKALMGAPIEKLPPDLRQFAHEVAAAKEKWLQQESVQERIRARYKEIQVEDEDLKAQHQHLQNQAAQRQRARHRRNPSAQREEKPLNVSDVRVRIPRDADDFETVCLEFLQGLGHSDAFRTPKGPDGGIDVGSSTAVGQAKFHPSQKVSGEFVRALAGSRQELQAGLDPAEDPVEAFFFHYGPGYTPGAVEAASRLRVRLLLLDVECRVFREIGVDDDQLGQCEELADE